MDLGVNAHRESPTIRSRNIRRPLKYILFGLAAVVLLGLVAPERIAAKSVNRSRLRLVGLSLSAASITRCLPGPAFPLTT
jgi:hypothetical protein